MSASRCQVVGCGRFVPAGTTSCAHHEAASAGEEPVLKEELDALRYVLSRLVKEINDIETLARHVPRVSSVAIQATRTRHQLGDRDREAIAALIGETLAELDGPP